MSIKDELFKDKDGYSRKGFSYLFIKKQKENEQNFIGNSAYNDLNTIVYGYVIGYKELYKPFLIRTVEWLIKGITNKEMFGENDFIHQYRLYSRLAFSYWLNGDGHKIELWEEAIKWIKKINFDYANLSGNVDKDFFALELISYIQAKKYEEAIELYKLVTQNKFLKLSNNMRGYRIAYAYCLHFYEGKFTVEQLEKAARPFLEKHLPMLYTKGRSTEMLYWLKMVCDAREKKYTPEEVIYTFYEYIPEEEKPDFVKELLSEKQVEKKSFFSFFKW